MKRLIILGSIIITSISLWGTATAAVEHLNLPVCNLAVYPYNATQPEIYNQAAVPFVNTLSEALCKSRTPYGSPYKQPPLVNENPLVNVADIGLKNVPYAQHYHSYINNALEDAYYYRSYIDKFEIKLQSDALNNTEKFQLQCQTPAPSTFTGNASDLSDCNGQVSDSNFYGGVKVTYNANTGIVLWEFGTVNKNLRPAMWGNNDSNPSDGDNFNETLSSVYGYPANLSDSNSLYRKFTPSVVLKSKNNSTEIWSGTTTSRALIRNYAILKSSFNAITDNNLKFSSLCSALGDFTKWCPVATPAGGYAIEMLGANSNQEWFWFPIGSVVSVWQKPSTPPSDLACADLQWDGAFLKKDLLGNYTPALVNQNALLPDESAVMKFKTIYESGTGTKRPLEYRWVSFYGDQNRPGWFTNEDSLFLQAGSAALEGYLLNSLPSRLLMVAHAAAKPAASGSSSMNSAAQQSTAAQSAVQSAMIKLGQFKDEISATLSGNPITDTDNQAYYSGGSEGVTVGVQAFYADGKNISGDGPMVTTPDGQKQKAQTCHLELVIQPKPVTCIDLEISPKDVKANTPVTFTVNPKFSPSNNTIPLNYRWSAEKYQLFQPGLEKNLGDMQYLPGVLDDNEENTWVGNGITDLLQTGNGLNNLLNGCPGGICGVEEAMPDFDPSGPITVDPIDQLQNEQQMLGANVFAEFGQAAVAKPSAGMTQGAVTAISQESLVKAYTPVVQNAGLQKEALAGPNFDLLGSLTYGGFRDSAASSTMAVNPYLEIKDNQTYYTGGPGGTIIKVQGEGKDGTLYPACKNSLVIPAGESLCQQLKVKFLQRNLEVAKENLVAGRSYNIQVDQANSKRTDGSPITKYSISVFNENGPGTLTASTNNAAGCSPVQVLQVINPGPVPKAYGTVPSTPVSCSYVYTPKAGDKITLLADPADGVAACKIEQVIPQTTTPICKSLNLLTSPLIAGNTITQGQLVAFSADPRDTENKPRPPVVYSETGNGYFIANPNNAPVPDCPAVPANSSNTVTFSASSGCKYSYQAPSDNTEASVTIKVNADDGVADCTRTFKVPSIPKEKEICLAINLRVNGQYTLNPTLVAGQSYALQVDPMTTQGNLIQMVEWSVNGQGKLIGDPSNPGICPSSIAGSAVTLSVCRYIFASPADATSFGFRVRAVPDNGVDKCIAQAKGFTPPDNQTPYCLYLDLNYDPNPFQTEEDTNMDATVVMSDGTPYNDYVRFTSTDGNGKFSGGTGGTSGSGTSNFRTRTYKNNTGTVNFTDGSADTGINIFLSDTQVKMSAACMRQLRPQPEEEEECTEPPVIVKYPGNRYCAEEGVGTNQYCWEIDGPGDLIFTNNSRKSTGDCVVLDEDYADFDLLVEDCNPEFRDVCFDRYNKKEKPEKPTIEKRISKTTNNYGRSVSFSTNGESTFGSRINYQIKFEPKNYVDGKLMNATIADPAFDGVINGYKYKDLNKNSDVKGDQITVDKVNIKVSQGAQFNSATSVANCPANFDPEKDLDNGTCYRYETKPEFKAGDSNSNGTVMVIYGIDSNEPIWITYFGVLKQNVENDQLEGTGLTKEDCQDGDFCLEQFYNQSYVTDMEYCIEETFTNEDGSTYTSWTCTPETQKNDRCEFYIGENGDKILINGSEKDCEESSLTIATTPTWVELVCQYFLTRASGDVFLEEDLEYGVDVSKCYPFKNISSTIVTPIDEITGSLAGTGTTSNAEIITINHEICSAGQSDFETLNLTTAQKDALKILYGTGVSEKLSSQICEVGLVPGSDWDKDSINAAISQNIGKLVRWDDGTNKVNLISDISPITNAGGVFYYKGSGNETVTIDQLKIEEGKGALTIIVENADLQINGNIEYTQGTPATTAEEISSLGVIVLNGNMYVDKNVSKLAGAYFVQRTGDTKDDDYYAKGNIISGTKADPNVTSEVMLTVNGSIYGNIGPLFQNRVAAGDISKDEGAITIRYDQRIIQNPPAGLAEILGTFSQSQIAQ